MDSMERALPLGAVPMPEALTRVLNKQKHATLIRADYHDLKNFLLDLG